MGKCYPLTCGKCHPLTCGKMSSIDMWGNVMKQRKWYLYKLISATQYPTYKLSTNDKAGLMAATQVTLKRTRRAQPQDKAVTSQTSLPVFHLRNLAHHNKRQGWPDNLRDTMQNWSTSSPQAYSCRYPRQTWRPKKIYSVKETCFKQNLGIKRCFHCA